MIGQIKVLIIGVSAILFSFQNGDDIRYFQSLTIPFADSTKVLSNTIYDSLSNQEIYQVRSGNGTPLYYYIELNTGVCFDNKCRPLNILVYWNITGRYLGFELLDGEFLSKYDHEPFSENEYERLHTLLADRFLPLGKYNFEELVKIPDTSKVSVDGVSGATTQDVLDYVVEGAAYTTHKLWNVVHGPVQQQVILQTEKQLDSSLFGEILQSPDLSDRTWALERIGMLRNLDESTIDSIVAILYEDEYFQSYLVLRSLNKEQVNSEILQLKLFDAIGEVDSGIEHMIFDKLIEADDLREKVIEKSITGIQSLNGMQLVKLLKLFKHHRVSNPDLCAELSRRLKTDNNYIRKQIHNFMEISSCL